MKNTIRFVPATCDDPDLKSAAEAANLHFRKEGINPSTAGVFRENLREAGLRLHLSRVPGVLLVGHESP